MYRARLKTATTLDCLRSTCYDYTNCPLTRLVCYLSVRCFQGLKLSACGQELGGDMLFGRRIGFSGTPSDILPLELGSCQYERGSDGRVVHYLTSPSIVQHVPIRAGWNSHLLLEFIARVSAHCYVLAFVVVVSNMCGLLNESAECGVDRIIIPVISLRPFRTASVLLLLCYSIWLVDLC
jgi:hypothetical protein